MYVSTPNTACHFLPRIIVLVTYTLINIHHVVVLQQFQHRQKRWEQVSHTLHPHLGREVVTHDKLAVTALCLHMPVHITHTQAIPVLIYFIKHSVDDVSVQITCTFDSYELRQVLLLASAPTSSITIIPPRLLCATLRQPPAVPHNKSHAPSYRQMLLLQLLLSM
jgi:hypothetical protein